jgi:predicted O-methyltransferase YrrM
VQPPSLAAPWQDYRVAGRANQDTFDAVDVFVMQTLFAAGDEVLGAANADAAAAGLPEIQVTPPQARLLEILCRTVGARRILEFGTLAGYSTIVMARTLPEDGILTTLEYDPDHAEVAWVNLERAGLADRVDLRVGAALETLPLLESEGAGPYDFVFIDADKLNTPAYFAWALDRTRPGGLIFADNVIRDGRIVDPDADEDSAAQRTFHEYLADEPRVTATTIQTVGAKGYDGFTLAFVL